MNLKPSEIYFSQARINNHFDKNSDHPYKNVGHTLDELVEGRCRVSDIPTISVKFEYGQWVTGDNRRLWVFRHLEKLGKCSAIPVKETGFIDPRKRNSTNGGRTVSFYTGKSAGGTWHHRVRSIDPELSRPIDNTSSVSSLSRSVCERNSVPSYFDNSTPDSSLLDSLTSLQIKNTSCCQELDPSEIRYTKEGIVVDYSIRTPPSNMAPITVYKVYGKYWVTDGNKRLWVCKNANLQNPFLKVKVSIKEDKDDFLDEVRKDRPYLSLIDILQSGDNIQVLN